LYHIVQSLNCSPLSSQSAFDLAYCPAFAFVTAVDGDLLAVYFIPVAGLFLMTWHIIAISGSGNSPNVIHAMMVARELGLTTIGLTGFVGGKLKDVVDYSLVVPSQCMEQIEDVHLIIIYIIKMALRGK
jgi:hypothetical protein